jgi:hypothetical protein
LNFEMLYTVDFVEHKKVLVGAVDGGGKLG